MLRLVDPPPPAAALDDVPAAEEVAAEEVAAELLAPPPDELELDPPPHAATPSVSAAALRSRAGSLNMAEISFFVVSRNGPGCEVTPRHC
jgi:hypothetical protein